MKDIFTLLDTLPSNLNLDVLGDKSDKAGKLYKAYRMKLVRSDQEALTYLFGDANHRNRYYRRVKSVLRTRVINTILGRNPDSNASQLQATFIETHKKATAAKILIVKGKRSAGTDLAEEALQVAVKFHLTDLIIELTKLLRDHYAISDNKKYSDYDSQLKSKWKVLESETLIDNYHQKLRMYLSQSKMPEIEAHEIAKDCFDKAKAIQEYHSSYQINYSAYRIYALYYQLIKDYAGLIRNCKDAISYFDQFDFDTGPTKRIFLLYLVPALISKRQFQEAANTIHKGLTISARGGHNWMAFQQYQIINSFYSGDFRAGYDVMEEIKQFKTYKRLAEEFRIYGAYLHFFALTGKLEAKSGRFKLAKFMNEVSLQEKDKKGMNVNLWILRILFLLQAKKWGAIIDQMENIQSYRYRHLRKDEATLRSDLFLKLLWLLPKHSFIQENVEREAAPLLAHLDAMPSNLMNHLDMEIVPYGKLWESVVELLL